MKKLFILFSMCFLYQDVLLAQNSLKDSTNVLTDSTLKVFNQYTLFLDDLNHKDFKDLVSNRVEQSQFVLVGESHGITEVGEITNLFYDLG